MHKVAAIPLLLAFARFVSAFDEIQLSCHSTELKDGDHGHETWRAHDEHCAIAIDLLEGNFGKRVDSASSGCHEILSEQSCAIYICDDYNVRQEVTYEMVWAAAEVIHARHRGGGTVGGYVSLDDNDEQGRLKRRTIMVAAKDVPDPLSNNRQARGLFGRRSQLDTEVKALVARTSHETNRTMTTIANTDDLNVDIQIGWGEPEWTPQDQMKNGMEKLLVLWNNNGNDQRPALRAGPYLAWNRVMVEMEWAAAQFEPAAAVHYQERATLINAIMGMRANMGHHSNFVVRVRRGTRAIGYLLIRTYRLVARQNINDLCG